MKIDADGQFHSSAQLHFVTQSQKNTAHTCRLKEFIKFCILIEKLLGAIINRPKAIHLQSNESIMTGSSMCRKERPNKNISAVSMSIAIHRVSRRMTHLKRLIFSSEQIPI